MNKRQLMSRLTKIGMAENEAKLYIAMLEKPEMTAGDLHRVAGVARSKIYDILEKMLAKGFCQERVENTRRYFKPVQPSFLDEILERQWEAELLSRKNASKMALGFLQSKYDRIQEAEPSLHLIEILRNLDHIRQKYLNLVNETRNEILTFNRSPYACQDPKVLLEQQKAIQSRLSKEVKLKSVYMWEESMMAWLEPAMMALRKTGEEIRVAGELPIKMMIFDRKKVLLALVDIPGESKADFTMVVIEDTGMIRSFLMLFETIWDASPSIEDWSSRDRGQ